MSDPSPSTGAPQGFRYPTRTKVIVAVVLALALGGFVLAGLRTASDTDPAFNVSGAPGEQRSGANGVEALIPGDGDEVLGQQRVGIDLAPGWTGELTILPATGQVVTLPEGEVERVTELDQIFFQPGPGKVVERLPGGQNCISATIWDRVQGREASERTEVWCFSVT